MDKIIMILIFIFSLLMVLYSLISKNITLFIIGGYTFVVGFLQPMYIYKRASEFGIWFIPDYALIDNKYISIYIRQVFVFIFAFIFGTLFFKVLSVKREVMLNTEKSKDVNSNNNYLALLFTEVILEIVTKKLLNFGAGKVVLIPHSGIIIYTLLIINLWLSYKAVLFSNFLKNFYLRAFIVSAIACIPSIVSGSRGAFLIRVIILSFMLYMIDAVRPKFEIKTILFGMVVCMATMATVVIASYLRNGTFINISGYLFKRVTGYVDGISSIRLNIISEAFDCLSIKSFFLSLLHFSKDKACIIYTRDLVQPAIFENGVPHVYELGKWVVNSPKRFDIELHGQAMPGFSAAYCYGKYMAVSFFGIIMAIILNCIESLRGELPIIHLVASYIYVGSLLIILDGNIEGGIEILVPIIGCIFLEYIEQYSKVILRNAYRRGKL